MTKNPSSPPTTETATKPKSKTSIGIWTVAYNAMNRPVRFTRTAEDGTVTTITADYDFMGRRVCKKVETTSADPETGDPVSTVTSHQRYLYRGYLQIAALDLTRSTLNALWYILWDPTEPVATRPLAIQTEGSWFTYGLDLTKNVTELYNSNGAIANAYTYAPFGGVTQAGNITNPLQWSSEVYDAELGMVYYNFRYYNPIDGRWTSRDPIGESGGMNLFGFVGNYVLDSIDYIGYQLLFPYIPEDGIPRRVPTGPKHPQVPISSPPTDSKSCPAQYYVVVGGAMDSETGLAHTLYKTLLPPKAYYHWDSGSDIQEAINKYLECCKNTDFILIGHSYGGDTVIDLTHNIQKQKGKINVVTLDPVSLFKSDRSENIDDWENIYIDHSIERFPDFNRSDWIASLGGHWGYRKGADRNKSIPPAKGMHHANASSLYKKSKYYRNYLL